MNLTKNLTENELVGDPQFPVSDEDGVVVGYLIADRKQWSINGTPVIKDGKIVGERVSSHRSYAARFIATPQP